MPFPDLFERLSFIGALLSVAFQNMLSRLAQHLPKYTMQVNAVLGESQGQPSTEPVRLRAEVVVFQRVI